MNGKIQKDGKMVGACYADLVNDGSVDGSRDLSFFGIANEDMVNGGRGFVLSGIIVCLRHRNSSVVVNRRIGMMRALLGYVNGSKVSALVIDKAVVDKALVIF